MVHSSTLITFITDKFDVLETSCNIVVKSPTKLHYSIIFKGDVAEGSCAAIVNSPSTIVGEVILHP
ncbi:hypothetical protein D3C85_1806730 [compost metagenome]